jgi:hypothetical protein
LAQNARQLSTLEHREADAGVLEFGVRAAAVPLDLDAQDVAIELNHFPQVSDEYSDHVKTGTHFNTPLYQDDGELHENRPDLNMATKSCSSAGGRSSVLKYVPSCPVL